MQIVAHRGASTVAPENTMAAFAEAVRMGADAVELDVQASADGVLVVVHDATLDRTTDGTGPVVEAPWAELAGLDAGRWFDERFAGEPLPRLHDVLALGGTALEVELKGYGAPFLEAVLRAVRAADALAVGADRCSTLDVAAAVAVVGRDGG